MSEQAQPEMSREEEEGVVARGLAELPEIVSVHHAEGHGDWDLVVVHNYGEEEDDVGKITDRIISFEDRVPRMLLVPPIIGASDEARGSFTAGMREIYRRK